MKKIFLFMLLWFPAIVNCKKESNFATETYDFSLTFNDDYHSSYSITGSIPDHYEAPEKSNSQTDRDNSTSSDYSTCYDLVREQALSRAWDCAMDAQNNHHTCQSSSSAQQKNYEYDEYTATTRLNFYLWCKNQKEYWIGPSKKTLTQQQDQLLAEQKKKADLAKNKEQKAEKEIEQNDAILNELEQAYAEHQDNCESSDDPEFSQVMQARNTPFAQSFEQQLTSQQFQLKNSTIGFLQAYDCDHQKFIQLYGLAIQHQFTQKLIDNLDAFADIADKNFNNQQLQPFIQSGVLFSDMAQSYNQANKLCDAMSASNCSHGQLHFLQAMMTDGLLRCKQLSTALSFLSCEVAKYSKAVARGAAVGAIYAEVTCLAITVLSAGANYIAPQLTASVYAGATSILVPMALTAATMCGVVLGCELVNLGCLYATDKIKLQQELQRIADFAQQFYNFDQAPEKHVENVVHYAGAFAWSYQRQAFWNSLLGMQKVVCAIYPNSGKNVSYSQTVSKKVLRPVLEKIDKQQVLNFRAQYKKIRDTIFLEIFANEETALVTAGVGKITNQEQQALVSHMLKSEGPHGGNAVKAVASQVVGAATSETILTTKIADHLEALHLIKNAPAIDPQKFALFMQTDYLVPGIEQYSQAIRQLAKTENFTKNLSSLTPGEIYYANKIHYTQKASSYAKQFIEKVQPGITYCDPDTNITTTYAIKDLAIHHVHSGEYGGRFGPTGGHCMPEFPNNPTFNPTFLKDGPHGSKFVRLHDPVKIGNHKDTSLYPLDWSHEKCDAKMFEALLTDIRNIGKELNRPNVLNIKCFTNEGMEIYVHFDIETGMITAHYPFIKI